MYNKDSDADVGKAIKKRKTNNHDNLESICVDIKYDDTDIEALIYVHLYPFGTGNWYRRESGMTLNIFAKLRLLNKDPRWRNDKYYIFYLFDTITQTRL